MYFRKLWFHTIIFNAYKLTFMIQLELLQYSSMWNQLLKAQPISYPGVEPLCVLLPLIALLSPCICAARLCPLRCTSFATFSFFFFNQQFHMYFLPIFSCYLFGRELGQKLSSSSSVHISSEQQQILTVCPHCSHLCHLDPTHCSTSRKGLQV